MSLINGLSGLGGGLNAFAGNAALEAITPPRAPLLNSLPPDAPVTEAASTPNVPPVAAQPDGAAGHKPGETVDPATLARAHQVYTGLVQRGMDPASAIGFAANAVQESAANPQTGAGDAGASHGLLQWRGDRLNNYVQMFGHAPEQGNLNEQLNYIMHEVSGPEANAWKTIQATPPDPASRAAAVSQYFERPKDTAAEIARRGWIAGQLAQGFTQIKSGG